MSDDQVLERLLTDRWSCRGFTDEPVPRDVIERLLTIAQRTPSWCNTQPWQLVITSGEETAKLRDAFLESFDWAGSDFEFPVSYNGVYRERRRESGWQLYEAVGVQKGDREASALQMLRNFEFFGAPHVAILTTDAGNRLSVSAGDPHDAAIWLIGFDDQHDVAVERGENRGRTLRYHHVVRELTRLAHWHGQALEVELPLARLRAARRAGAAILVQRLSHGVILAAVSLRLPPG